MDHLSEYIVTLFAPEDELLGALREEADRSGFPPASIAPDAGRFLQVLLRAIAARRVLEVGTLQETIQITAESDPSITASFEVSATIR